MVFPAIIRQVIDFGLGESGSSFIAVAAGIILGLGVLRALVGFAFRYLTEWIAHHIAYDIRNRLYDRIQRMPFTFHDQSQSGQLISRCIEDVRSVQNFAGHGIMDLSRVTFLLIAIVIVLFAMNPFLAVLALLPIVPILIVSINYGKSIGKLFLVVDNHLGDLSSRLQENVIGVQVVRAFTREKHEIKLFEKSNRQLFESQLKVVREWSKIMPTTGQLVVVGTVLILWFGGQMVLRGEITLGELVAFNSYLLLLSGPAQQLSWIINGAGEASAGLQRAFDILDHVPAIQSPPDAVVLPPLKGEVSFKDVDFHYSGEKTSALHNITFNVAPNQVVALIGPTGSGKTSLVNLIPRFYDVSAGCVLVDGYDVRSVELNSLRRQIGLVLQTSLLFSCSIRENIAYGRPDAGMEEIQKAAEAAQAYEFIQEFPKGYDTVVGERGVTLSGGQRQRIAIARALLMNPPILILDDSTSSVDTQTEFEIQTALNNLMEGRTTFIIAQRLSSVKRADKILVMDQGRIVETGTHSELVHQDGLYRKIYELQLRDQEKFREEIENLEDEKPEIVSVSLNGQLSMN
jgi:ATP-binding cassette subfamily B protein